MISKSEYKLLKAIKNKIPLDNVSVSDYVYESIIKNGYVYFFADNSADLLPKGEGAIEEYEKSTVSRILAFATFFAVFGSFVVGIVALILNKP